MYFCTSLYNSINRDKDVTTFLVSWMAHNYVVVDEICMVDFGTVKLQFSGLQK